MRGGSKSYMNGGFFYVKLTICGMSAGSVKKGSQSPLWRSKVHAMSAKVFPQMDTDNARLPLGSKFIACVKQCV